MNSMRSICNLTNNNSTAESLPQGETLYETRYLLARQQRNRRHSDRRRRRRSPAALCRYECADPSVQGNTAGRCQRRRGRFAAVCRHTAGAHSSATTGRDLPGHQLQGPRGGGGTVQLRGLHQGAPHPHLFLQARDRGRGA